MKYPRVIGIVLALGVVLLAGCGGGGGSGSSDSAAPTVSGVTISGAPKFSGGPITVSGHVSAGSGVSSVAARVTYPEGTVVSAPLANAGGDLYTGVFNAPANNTAAAKNYSVVVVVTDGAGKSATSSIMTFSVPCPIAPPPPPT